jgi:hypothetical protein
MTELRKYSAETLRATELNTSAVFVEEMLSKLKQALTLRKPMPDFVINAERGSQYSSEVV